MKPALNRVSSSRKMYKAYQEKIKVGVFGGPDR